MNKLDINDLNYIITECINLLVENTSVSAAYRKYFNNIPEDKYKELVELDPTYKGSDVMGKYGVWILNQYKKGNIENTEQLRTYLEIFTKFINRIDNKNIQSYKNPEELRTKIQPFLDSPNQATSKSKAKMKVKEGAKNVYEDSDWVVIIPETWESSKYYGANTKWCTTEKDTDSYFNEYSSQGPLYIIINKKTKAKYQLHMPDSGNWQFKDAEDNEVKIPCFCIGLSDGIVDFFNGLSNGEFESTYLEPIENDLGEGMTWVMNKKGSFLIGNGKEIKIENYKYIEPFKEGFACVQRKDEKFNFINTEGKLISDAWWENCDNFSNGFATVQGYDWEWNFINTEGKVAFDTWWEDCGNFHEGFARVLREDGKRNFINKEGKVAFDTWWKWCYDFSEGFAKVLREGGEWNFINKEGKLISDTWWDYCGNFSEGFARVRKYDYKWNFINKEGKLLSDNWWKDCDDFSNGIAEVKGENGVSYKIDKNGNIHKVYDE